MDDKGFDVQSIYFEKNYDYEFSPIEISHRNAIHLGYFLYENDFYQFREGLMDQATWDSKIAGLKGLYNQCSMRSIYNTRSATFSKDFVEIIESFRIIVTTNNFKNIINHDFYNYLTLANGFFF